jgi:hypothetical protein
MTTRGLGEGIEIGDDDVVVTDIIIMWIATFNSLHKTILSPTTLRFEE